MSDSRFEYVAGARPEPTKEALFDVVFVHGLTGDSEATWRHENGEFWPSWLAHDFPQINVYTVGYPSALTASVGKGAGASLADRGTILLDRLVSRPSSNLPIVFITHSLGGLVVKQALRKSQDASAERRRRVGKSVLGVVFIATPHAGAQIAKTVNSIIRSATSKSVRELEYADDSLLDLSAWFSNWANERKFLVECYYEVEKYKGLMVVDQVTANPNVNGCDPVAIQEDHVSITKLASKSSQLYRSVSAVLQELLDKLGECGGGGGDDDEIASEFAAYTDLAAADRRSLAEKLSDAGREHEIVRAEQKKERFAMTLQRNIAQPAAVRRYTRLMSNIETRYHRHVGPMIAAGSGNQAIDDALQANVLDPCLHALDAEGVDGTPALVDSAFYFLAGNCHLAWDQ